MSAKTILSIKDLIQILGLNTDSDLSISQKIQRIYHHQTVSQQILKEFLQIGNKRERKGLQKQTQNYKQMVIGSYISIITFNMNGINAATKRHRLAEWIQMQNLYMLSTRHSPQIQGHIQTESEGLEKDILRNQKSKERGSSNTQIKQTLK